VFTAENGFEAVKIVSEKPSDYFVAVILDINMPIMDGFEACIQIDKILNESGEVLPISKPVKYRHWNARKSRTLLICLSADISSARKR